MTGVINGVLTAVLLVLFIAIWIWAWSSRNKKAFDEMANLPLEDEPSAKPDPSGDKDHE